MRYLKLIVLLIIICTVVLSTVVLSQSDRTVTFLGGNDCYGFHHQLYVGVISEISYEGSFNVTQNITLRVTFNTVRSSGIFSKFSVESTLFSSNETLTVVSGEQFQEKNYHDSKLFTVEWEVRCQSEGFYPVTVVSNISVSTEEYHPGYIGNYRVENRGGFDVLNFTDGLPSVITHETDLPIDEIIDPKISDLTLLTSQLTGYGALVLFTFVALLGIKPVQLEIIRSTKLSRKAIRKWHCDLGYVAFILSVLHVILLLLTNKWGTYFDILSLFIPSFDWLSTGQINSASFALDLSRFALVVYGVVTLGGIYFYRIAVRYGRSVALVIQQLSYLALVAVSWHAISNGTFAQLIWIKIIVFLLPISLISLRLYYWWVSRSKEREINIRKGITD